MTQSQIGDELHISGPTVSRRLKALGLTGYSDFFKKEVAERRASSIRPILELKRQELKYTAIGDELNLSPSGVSMRLIRAGHRSKRKRRTKITEEMHNRIVALGKPGRDGRPKRSGKEIASLLNLDPAPVSRHLKMAAGKKWRDGRTATGL